MVLRPAGRVVSRVRSGYGAGRSTVRQVGPV